MIPARRTKTRCLVSGAERSASQDPYLHATKRWISRRLAADCSRIDLDAIPMRNREAMY
jgi:hypothetical protein